MHIQSIIIYSLQITFAGDAELHGDQKVRNLVIDMLEEVKAGWAPDSVDTIGENFVRQLSNTLWYLDPHHEKFLSRSIHLPSELDKFQGFNDWRRKKIKQPTLSSADLDCHIQDLSGILSQPWISKVNIPVLNLLWKGL